MATVKKRKVNAECRVFLAKWTNDCVFFVVVDVLSKWKANPCAYLWQGPGSDEKAQSSITGESMQSWRSWKDRCGLIKVSAFRRSLDAQQSAWLKGSSSKHHIKWVRWMQPWAERTLWWLFSLLHHDCINILPKIPHLLRFKRSKHFLCQSKKKCKTETETNVCKNLYKKQTDNGGFIHL